MIHHRAVKGRIVGLLPEHWSRRYRSSTGSGPMLGDPASITCSTRTFGEHDAVRTPAGRNGPRGGILFSVRPSVCRIGWLVVAPGDRGNGVGRALVTEVARRLDGPGVVGVVTFSDDHPAAAPNGTRRFYESLDFSTSVLFRI